MNNGNIMVVQSLKYIGELLFDIKGVKAEPRRKRNTTEHTRSPQTLKNSSNLNNQTRTSTDLSLPRTQSSPKLNSRLSTDSVILISDETSVEPGNRPVLKPLYRTKLKNPSPSDILRISDLNIGNLISTKRSTSQEDVLESSDCITDSLSPSNRGNQSKAKPDGGNQSGSEIENSANEDMDNSLILVSDNIAASSAPRGQHVCRVLHCEAVFTSQAKLNHHMNQFQHSPCNPCLKAKDGKLLPDPICYMCPKCDEDFKTTSECSAHMRSQDHLPYLPPLKIAGYICPQCLAIFENFEACWNHISVLSHHIVSYPFIDDVKGPHPVQVGPVAIAEELAMDFIEKCKKVAFRVQCLECSLEIETAMMLRQHMAETNKQHPVFSLADCNLVDVFADYLAEFQCYNCYRLFTKYIPTHCCAKDVLGMIIESNVRSFHDFVKSCALTLSHPEPDSLSPSTIDCTATSQGQASCPDNLIQVVQHSSETVVIPKNTGQASALSRTPDTKTAQNKIQEHKNDDVIIIDTPPDPPKTRSRKGIEIPGCSFPDPPKTRFERTSEIPGAPCSVSPKTMHGKVSEIAGGSGSMSPKGGYGRVKEIPVEEQKFNADQHLNRRKKTRLDTESAPGMFPEKTETESHRQRSRSPATPHPTATENLVKMKNIIFLDLDNWPGFFSKLPRRLPDCTFVWGFYGGKVVWREPERCYAFTVMKSKNLFHLHDRCGHTKDAADFAIVLTVGQMHERLPKHIPFTIVSGDKGFIEVERQMRDSHRKAVVIDPHSAQQFSNDMIYTMVTSVADT